jgi:uncharacterized protein YaiE (UPF0345 family)
MKKYSLFLVLLLVLIPHAVWASADINDPFVMWGKNPGDTMSERQIIPGKNTFFTDNGANSTLIPDVFPQSTQSAAVSLTVSSNTVQLVSNAGATYAITLPAASTTAAKRFLFFKTDNNTNQITITAAGADTINGSATYALKVFHGAIEIQSDGTSDWKIVNSTNIVDLTGILPVANGGTGAATGTNPSWFGCSGSTTPAFQTGLIPSSLVAGSNYPLTSKSSSFTAAGNNFYVVTATSTCTLPTAVGIAGEEIGVLWNATGTLTFNTTSSQTMSGIASGSVTTTITNDQYWFISDGANWFIE